MVIINRYHHYCYLRNEMRELRHKDASYPEGRQDWGANPGSLVGDGVRFLYPHTKPSLSSHTHKTHTSIYRPHYLSLSHHRYMH